METRERETILLCGKELDPESKRLLMNTAKWAKFLSVVGFVVFGIFIVAILSMVIMISATNSYMEHTSHSYGYISGTASWVFICTSIVLALVYLIPIYFLYKFSVSMKQAIPLNNQVELVDAFRYLSKHYTFIGVLTLAILVYMVIIFINIFISLSM